jgi:hypothetical protein
MRLHAAALRARRKALEHLGEDAERFTAAIERYVNAVESRTQLGGRGKRRAGPCGRSIRTARSARASSSRSWSYDRAALRFGAALGLDPSAARKLGRIGQPGRPLGAVSAPDRVAGPPIVRLRAIPQNEPAKWSRLGRVDPDDV